MRRLIFVISTVVLGLAVSASILWENSDAHIMIQKHNVKDIPEHGLAIVTGSDPSFNSFMEDYLRIQPTASAEKLRPYSIFIKNTGNQAVIGYRLKWECLTQDGTIVNKVETVTTSWALTNGGDFNVKDALKKARTVIRPNSTLFFSLVAPPLPLDVASPNTTQSNPKQEELVRDLDAEFTNYTEITIVLDGAVLEDGAFVGPDSTGYFEMIKAQVDAKDDLLNEIDFRARQGMTSDEIFRQAQEAANLPDINLDPHSTPAQYYSYYKKLFAQEPLGIRKSSGDAKAIEHVRRLLGKPRLKLRKI